MDRSFARGYEDPDRTRFVATTALRRADLIVIARKDLSSSLVAQTAWAELVPWSEEWEALVTNQVSKLLGNKSSTGRWSKAVSAITGGHPHLVADAIGELRKLGEPERHSLEQAAEKVLEQFLKVRLATGGGFSQICRALEELPADDKALLKNIVCGEAKLSDADSSRVARLLSSGLVYIQAEDNDLRLKVVSGMVSDQARTFPKPVTLRELRHVPDKQRPQEQGSVDLIDDGRIVVSISLAGTPWKILSVVFDADGEVVPRGRLREVTRLEKKALNSALQRLRASLKAAGIEHALESVRNVRIQERPLSHDWSKNPPARPTLRYVRLLVLVMPPIVGKCPNLH